VHRSMFLLGSSTRALVLVVVVDLVMGGGCREAEDADEEGAIRFLLVLALLCLGLGLVVLVVFTKVVMTLSFLSSLLLVLLLLVLFM